MKQKGYRFPELEALGWLDGWEVFFLNRMMNKFMKQTGNSEIQRDIKIKEIIFKIVFK